MDKQSSASLALHATASFFGQTVEETFSPRGRPLQIGNSDAMAVPVPEGREYLARISWVAPRQAVVVDGEGREHLLRDEAPVHIDAGPVSLDLHLVPQFRHPRFAPPSWRLSLGWAVTVLAATVGTMSINTATEVLDPHVCEILARAAPLHPRLEALFVDTCSAGAAAGGWNGVYTAEYLARLLKEDYAGSDQGGFDIVNPDHEKKGDSFYLPAGAPGPATEMGGAEEVAPEPVRQVGEELSSPPPSTQKGSESASVVEEGAPVADAVGIEDGAPKGGIGAENDEKGGDATLAEEKEGWGVKDWYDTSDKQLDDLEIDLSIRVAKHRLRIDPHDPEALSVLSYYQYLAEDFDGASQTYDTYLELFPESSAGYNNKALVYKRRKDYVTEEALYRKALLYEPDDVTALNNLAVNLSHQHRFNEALAIMKHLETADPDDPYADLHRAKVSAEMGDDEAAYGYLEKALDGMARLDTLHHIEFRQDIRVDPSFARIRESPRFHAILVRYYGKDSPLEE